MALVGGGENSQISFLNMFNSVRCYSKSYSEKPIEISRRPRGGHITYRCKCKIWSDLFLRNKSYRLLNQLVSSNDL